MKNQVFNPYLPSCEYIPDGEPRVFGERVYIFGSHDRFNGTAYCENDYVCWSAPTNDLSAWKYEGVIFRQEDHPDEATRRELYAPDVVQGVDGRYYLYYSTANSSIISVAVCNEPAGKYEYLHDVCTAQGVVYGNHPGEYFQFDPAVLVDDGRVYLYSGFANPKKEVSDDGIVYVGAHVCELEQDMYTIKVMPHVLIDRKTGNDDNRYFEAPSVRKINEIYYFIYSVKIRGLHYYYSDSPDSGYIYGGRIHSTSNVGINGYRFDYPSYPIGNTHGGIVKINNEYYIFDHRFTNNSRYCRQGVAEKIMIDKNGHIAQVEETSCGLNGGPLLGKGDYPAYIACVLINYKDELHQELKQRYETYITQNGEDCENPEKKDAPRQYVHQIVDNTLLGYKYFKIENLKSIELKIRGEAKGIISILTSENSNVIGKQNISISSLEWRNLKIPVCIENGVYPVFIMYSGEGWFDLDSLIF